MRLGTSRVAEMPRRSALSRGHGIPRARCYRLGVGQCDACRGPAKPVHVPLSGGGHFCGACCPVCEPGARDGRGPAKSKQGGIR